jgi:hypothetical protein
MVLNNFAREHSTNTMKRARAESGAAGDEARGGSAPHSSRRRPKSDVPVAPVSSIDSAQTAPPAAASLKNSVGVTANRAGSPLQQQPIPHLNAPLNAQLLSCFGGFNAESLFVLEHFFALSLQFSKEEVVRGLVTLSNGMASAVETHMAVKNDLLSVNSRAERIFAASKAADRLCEELRSEMETLKVNHHHARSSHLT